MLKNLVNPFLILLKSGLWGEEINDLSHFKLSESEWEYLYDFSKAQTVEGVVFEGILRLPKDIMPPKTILYKWTARVDSIERINLDMRGNMSTIVNVFKRQGITPILLKGFGLAENYLKPELRINGDIDLYFNKHEDFLSANNFLSARNVRVEKGDHKSVFYNYKGVEFEHHTKLFDLFNPLIYSELNGVLNKEHESFQVLKSGTCEVLIPSYLVMQIQTNAHILKHFLGFGIGLRQFCDVARLCAVKPNSFDGNSLLLSFKKLKIDRWMNLVYSFLVNHLGMSMEHVPYKIKLDKNTNWLLNEILQVGNFGFYYNSEKNNVKLDREISRSNSIKRVIPHIFKAYQYVPSEAFWYPLMKIYTKIVDR